TGGSIVATGGDPIGGSTAGGGAGIGGGDGSYGMYGTGGNITIGGNAQVTATGGWGAAGIGGGASIGSSIESDGGVIKIGDDAVVTAIGGDGGAGIGGGTNSGSSGADNGSGGNITVGSDARVTATGSGGGAGIGGGARISGPGGNGGTIIINSGTVIATGGSGGGAGIGGGSGGNGAAFTTYSAAYIEAYSYYQGAGSRPAIHASNSPTLGDGWYVNAFFTTPFLSPMTLNVFEEGDTDVLLAALTLPANYRAFAFQIPPGSSAAKDYNVYAETATGPEPVVHDDADESAVISSVKSLTGYSGHGGTDGALPVKMGVTLYTVTFDPDNVTDMPWTELAAAGGHLTEPTGYTKAGYIIDGWYEGAVKWDFGTDTVSGDMTLTAKWTAVWEATVNLTLDGSAWDGQTVELYSGAIKVADLIDSAGSYSAEVIDGTYAIYVNGTDTGETITIFGAPDSVTLDYFTLTLNTSTGISSVTGDGIYLSGSVVSIDAVVSAGYIWEKWVEITTTGIGEDTNKSTSVTVNDTIELTATAAVPVYTLTVYLTLDAVAWDGQTVELYVGAVKMADLTDNADGSYDSDVIDGTYAIYVNGDDTGRTVTISGAPDNVTIDYFTLTLNAGTGISSVTGGGIYIDGSVVNIDAAVSSGYVWEKWVEITTTGIGEDINKSTSVMMSDTIELTATATVSEYTVTVIADEGSEFEYTITGGTTGTFTVDASGMYEIPDKVPYGSSIDIWTTSGPVDEVEWTYGPPGHEVRSVGIFTKSITEDLTVTAKLLPPPAPPAPWPWAVLAALGLLFLLIFLDDDDEEIFGKVTHNGKGAEGVSIVYMSDDSVRRTVTTDRDGDYSIPVTVGSVVVILDAVGYSSSAVSIDGTAAQDGLPLRVKAEKDRTRVNITVKE
ncbi:MAG: InlB B-repeat-containing protein, partial [Methanomassiliicoccaceae archaeon]|nr:InlB B-repeat-containing protein [Methanomassiliicoccaceae archaeon]